MNSNKETNVSLFLEYLNLNLYSSFEILLGFFFFFLLYAESYLWHTGFLFSLQHANS